MQGLDWQTLQLPLAAGLQQKADDRARSAPFLDIANDVQFDEQGGLQTRYPYAALGTSILGGGSISNPRRLVANGDELLLFTSTGLYSWNAQLSKWVLKGTHLAVKVEEQPVFINTDDQIDCDRAELDGAIVYTWASTTSDIYVAAIDKETGSELLAPTLVSSNGLLTDGERPRLVALETAIHLYWIDTSDPTHRLVCVAIDPADVSGSVQTAPTEVESDVNDYYDVVRIPGEDTAVGAFRLDPTTSYTVFTLSADTLTLASSTKARTCDGPIAVSCPPTGTQVQVIRADGTDIKGDLITISGLVDTFHVNKAVGTVAGGTVYQIAACHRSTQDSGQYRCYAFWHAQENAVGTIDWTSKYNYVDTGGGLGTQANFVRKLAVASRAFEYGGHVFVHMAFAGTDTSFRDFGNQLQNTFFLYRDDATLVAKLAPGRAGGFPPSIGRLPSVELTGGTTVYSWCGTQRRIVDLGSGQYGYEDRGPVDITLTFDSNEARRCARLGQTLYITGGELMQYDGSRLVELGFHIFPWSLTVSDGGGAGGVEDGTYTFKVTLRDDNGRGERDRSTTATYKQVTMAGGVAQGVDVDNIVPLYVTHRSYAIGSSRDPSIEIWRSQVNPLEDSPFFLTTSKDPSDTLGANCYIVNDPTAHVLSTFHDGNDDDDLADNEANPENGGFLETVAPPACSIVLAGDSRLFIAGIAGEPDVVRYSKQRDLGEVASFSDFLAITVPNVGGDITALAFLNETLIVFRETAVYALPGDGFDNTGGGSNFGPARMLSSDVGAVNHESVVFTPGGLVFKSSKGWYLLNRGWSLDYIGAPVTDYDSETPLAAHLVEKQHQVRILTASRMLVWDYLVQQWAEWTIADGLHACIWDGAHVYLSSSGPKVQGTSYTSLTFGIDVETAWIKPSDLQGFSRVRKLQVLGELRSSDVTHLRIRIKYNYVDSSYVDDRYWPVSPTTVGGPLQLKIGPSRQQIQSIKIRITTIRRTEEFVDDVPTTVNGPPTGEAIKLTGLALEVGLKRGAYPRLPAAQRS